MKRNINLRDSDITKEKKLYFKKVRDDVFPFLIEPKEARFFSKDTFLNLVQQL